MDRYKLKVVYPLFPFKSYGWLVFDTELKKNVDGNTCFSMPVAEKKCEILNRGHKKIMMRTRTSV